MVFAKDWERIEFLIEIFLLEVMLFNISLNIPPLLLILYACTCSKRAVLSVRIWKSFRHMYISLQENKFEGREQV